MSEINKWIPGTHFESWNQWATSCPVHDVLKITDMDRKCDWTLEMDKTTFRKLCIHPDIAIYGIPVIIQNFSHHLFKELIKEMLAIKLGVDKIKINNELNNEVIFVKDDNIRFWKFEDVF